MKIANRAIASLALVSVVEGFWRPGPQGDGDSGDDSRALEEDAVTSNVDDAPANIASKEQENHQQHSGSLRKLQGKGYYPPPEGKGYYAPPGKGYYPKSSKGKGYYYPKASKGKGYYPKSAKGKGYYPPAGKGKGYYPPEGKGKGYYPEESGKGKGTCPQHSLSFSLSKTTISLDDTRSMLNSDDLIPSFVTFL